MQKSAEPISPVTTRQELAKVAGVSHDTIAKVEKIEQKAPEAVKKQLRTGEICINKAYNAIKLEEKKETIRQAEQKIAEQATNDTKPIIYIRDSIEYKPTEKYDLLLTDPPYSTDIEDIDDFWDSSKLRRQTKTAAYSPDHPEGLPLYS